ncbi:shikimate dehydrogenase [Veronia nyctiphanis]|uniref:Shikimate dehydrogenase n=1 Tax=Veronia nyctiphanis TaxID=1278244 RepID=A0A4Q0YP69_9GAMM|nr:acetyltransferase [Veronia nyctiphanis]RXJ72807.1 shikimate dehydrogenase [Veronia nyctiphanis]
MSDPVLPVVIIGGGGHASVLVDILRQQNRDILAVISPDPIDSRSVFNGILHLLSDDDIHQFETNAVRLINGIGMLPGNTIRKHVANKFEAMGYRFDSVIASSAIVSPFAQLADGVQLFPGSIVQAGSQLGTHSIVNSAALIEHDCVLGNFNHVAPRATLCGQVECHDSVFIGAGATVIQSISIGTGAIIGAGAAVTKDLSVGHICLPAQSVQQSIEPKVMP